MLTPSDRCLKKGGQIFFETMTKHFLSNFLFILLFIINHFMEENYERSKFKFCHYQL
jgi:hypothetical protein